MQLFSRLGYQACAGSDGLVTCKRDPYGAQCYFLEFQLLTALRQLRECSGESIQYLERYVFVRDLRASRRL